MKPEWGSKHTCGNCGAHFYDMRKPDARCPKCDTPMNDEQTLLAKLTATETQPASPEDELLEDLEEIENEYDTTTDAEEFLEDAGDLVGSDDADMSEVMDHVEPVNAEQNI